MLIACLCGDSGTCRVRSRWIASQSERNVIRQLLNDLDDDRYIVPKVPVLIEGQNAEIDVVLVSPHLGVVLVEIKGGLVSVKDGV